MIRCRNCWVRGSRGALKIWSGGPCSSSTPASRKHTRSAMSRANAHLVRGDQHRHAARRQLADHAQHLRHQLRVERARHLVQQHQPRPRGQGADDRHPLLLAARQPVGDTRRACRPGRTAPAARAPPPSACARGVPSTLRGASVTLSITRHVREQVERLEHDADASPHPVRVDPLGGHLRAMDDDAAAVRPAPAGRCSEAASTCPIPRRRSGRSPRAPRRRGRCPRSTSSLPNDLWRSRIRSAGAAGSLTPPARPAGAACRGRSASR